MRYHRQLYPPRTSDSVLSGAYYPYKGMEDSGVDLKVDMKELPTKLINILRQYVDMLGDED